MTPEYSGLFLKDLYYFSRNQEEYEVFYEKIKDRNGIMNKIIILIF